MKPIRACCVVGSVSALLMGAFISLGPHSAISSGPYSFVIDRRQYPGSFETGLQKGHYDRCRSILRTKEENGDFYGPNADAFRSLYLLDPDAALLLCLTHLGFGELSFLIRPPSRRLGEFRQRNRPLRPRQSGSGIPPPARVPGPDHGPLTLQAVAADNVRNLLRGGTILHPLRPGPAGAISYFRLAMLFLPAARPRSIIP